MEVDEARVEEWDGELRVIGTRLRGRFARRAVRDRAIAYMKGLLSEVPRKNGWQMAEAAGEETPDGMQRLLKGAVWDEAGVRDDLVEYVVEGLGESEAVLVVDETGFLKQGEQSVGVKRQYSGTAGRIANCQVGVFLAYTSRRGHVLLDRRLYLPQEWCADTARRRAAGVPESVDFATKPALAQHMLERALDQHVPFAWVSGDSIYGGDRRLRVWLESHALGFVLGIAKDEPLWRADRQVRADVLAQDVADTDWQRLSCGQGAKGPRLYDWAVIPLPRLRQPEAHQHALLVRRSLSTAELAYYVVFAPAPTPLPTLVNVAGQRWTIEECFALAKNEVGLDHYEVRHWTAWHRHITLALWALAFLAVTAAQAAEPPPQKKRSAFPATPQSL